MGTYNIAQMVEHLTSNDGVHGSIPCVGASQSLALAGSDAEAQKRNVDKFFHLKANHVEKEQAAQNHPFVCHVPEMVLVPFLSAAFSGRMQQFGGRNL